MVSFVRARATGVITLLVLAISTVEMPHAAGVHYDPDCDLVVVAHDASAHRIDSSGPTQAERPEHCLACHWGRSFRPGVDADGVGAPLVETTVAVVPAFPSVHGRAPVAQPPLRSPPA